MKEENQAIIKALNMYGRVPEHWELLNEIERLNNIINELEKWAKEQLEHPNWASCGARCMLDKLQELKGDSSNE